MLAAVPREGSVILIVFGCVRPVSEPLDAVAPDTPEPGQPAGAATALPVDFDPGEHPVDDPTEDEGVPDDDDCPELAWQLNVVVFRDLGTTAQPYSSDFEGAALVGGDAWFQAFSLNDRNPVDLPFALIAGGRVSLDGGSIRYGGVDAGGAVRISSGDVQGDARSGGDLDGGFGTVHGDAVLAGSNRSQLSVLGELTEGVDHQASVDFDAVERRLRRVSQEAAEQPDSALLSEAWGELIVELHGGDNFVSLSAEELDAAWGVTVRGPEDAALTINVPDSHVAFDSLVWTYEDGAAANRTLLNLYGAQTVELSGGEHHVAVLAPDAALHFPSGLVTGNVVARALTGGGQVNTDNHDDPCDDEPHGGGPS